jgi:hypothetical protein
MTRGRDWFLLSVMLSASCFTSPPLSRDPIVQSPLGVHGAISVGAQRFAGELLAITTADFVLLTDRRLVVIPFMLAGPGDFSAIDIRTYGAPWGRHVEQLRLASRFPHGIPDEAMKAILTSRGQTAPDTIKAASR